MSRHELLGQIHGLQSMMAEILNSVDEGDGYQMIERGLPPLAWLYGRCVYAETYWVREVLENDKDMTQRVKHIFANNIPLSETLLKAIPNREHLFNWALELQDDNLMKLANPSMLEKTASADHPLIKDNHLLSLILQEYALRYEQMIANLNAINAKRNPLYQVMKVLKATSPSIDHAQLHGGHYRIGAKDNPYALPNEFPTQVVELSSFRIDKKVVSNSAWLGFMEGGGYDNRSLWTDEGWAWCEQNAHHPYYWRQDIFRQWYIIGLNGASDLVADDAVSGISQHEAMAYANWVAEHGDELSGAVLQHEYQWEAAMRAGQIARSGSVREWCANPHHLYSGYQTPEYEEQQEPISPVNCFSIRGTSLHTPRAYQRISYRQFSVPEKRFMFTGARLVFPSTVMPWHKS